MRINNNKERIIMAQHKILPFKFESWDSPNGHIFDYFSVEFTRFFKNIDMGAEFEHVEIDYLNGTMSCYEREGYMRHQPVFTTNFKCE